MKYRLNLYTSQFRHERLPLGRQALLLAVGLAILLMAIISATLQWTNQGLADRHRLLADKQQRLENEMLALSKQFAERAKDKALLKLIADESLSVRGKRHLLKRLSGDRLLTDARFSRTMRGLAESHVQGLWLTRVRTDGNSLVLNGSSLSEALLPEWIRQLSRQREFNGKSFGQLELSRPNDKETSHLDFHLSTQLISQEVGNG